MNIKVILIDLDGVIYASGKVIPGAVESIQTLQSKSFREQSCHKNDIK